MMTIQAWNEAFRALLGSGRWRVLGGVEAFDVIRLERLADGFKTCPVSAVAVELTGHWYGCGDYLDAARVLSLPRELARGLAYLSDRCQSSTVPLVLAAWGPR